MSMTVVLYPSALGFPLAGGHFWAYVNWVLGLRSLDCNVIWLEGVAPEEPYRIFASTALSASGIGSVVNCPVRSDSPLAAHFVGSGGFAGSAVFW